MADFTVVYVVHVYKLVDIRHPFTTRGRLTDGDQQTCSKRGASSTGLEGRQ